MTDRDALFDRFLNSRLERGDAEIIEQLAATDAAFLKELAFRKALRRSVEAVQNETLLAGFEKNRRRLALRRAAKFAAFFAMFLGAAFWFFYSNFYSNFHSKKTAAAPNLSNEIAEKLDSTTQKLPVWQVDSTGFLDQLRQKNKPEQATEQPLRIDWQVAFFQKKDDAAAHFLLKKLLGDNPENWPERPEPCFYLAVLELKKMGPTAQTAQLLETHLAHSASPATEAQGLLIEAFSYQKETFSAAQKMVRDLPAAQKMLPERVRKALENDY